MAQRIIKFRGKHIVTGEWLYGSHFDDGGEQYILPNNILDIDEYEDKYEVDPATVGQFTGLEDMNGNRIFEGDVVSGTDTLARMNIHGYVSHSDASFVIIGELFRHYRWMDYDVEVIGNIHDNPELLEGGED
jgi:uncharacterized phage protein (TIGR01671 family)